MKPNLDLSLRHYQAADPELLKMAMKWPKPKKKDTEKGLEKKRKNLKAHEIGDLKRWVHVGKQYFGNSQTRQMKGLMGGDVDEEDADPDGFGDGGRWERGISMLSFSSVSSFTLVVQFGYQ